MAASVSSRTRSGINSCKSQQQQQQRICVGCGGQIHDQFILRVAPNLEWHAACLKCCQCQKFLDEKCTCFVRDGKIFCKEDYVRLFGTKCEKCSRSFGASDFVMRAKNKIFHLECFRCVACNKQLVPGDEFALRPEGLFCKEDHANEANVSSQEDKNNNSKEDDSEDIASDQDDDDKDLLLDDRFADSGMDDLGSEKSPCSSVGGGSRSDLVVSSTASMGGELTPTGSLKGSSQIQQQRRSRAGRVRTVLTEKQLSLLKSCYAANPRPDALMKEQLVEMTGLSPRVVRVWFQNKRCKDKKKLSLQKSKEGRKLGYSAMTGVPMVATSPMRHDASASLSPHMHPVDVHSYEPPWKALCDFALHSNLDRPGGYNHLVNELHGFQPEGSRPPPPHLMHHHMDPEYPMPPDYMPDQGAMPPPPDSYTLTSLDSIAGHSEA